MRVTILGSGSLVPNGRRGPAGYLVESDSTTLLVDGGSGTLRRIAEAGVDYRRIDHLLYTHVHPDHTGDLVPFLFAQRTTPGFERTEPLRIFGPRGFRAFFDRVREVYGRWIESDRYPLLVRELWGEGAGAGNIEFETFRMQHSVACIGYRFTGARGETVAYTGDTDATPEVARLAADVDVLIADCSAPDEAKIEGHLTPGEVGRLAAQGRARHVVLSHLYPRCEGVDLVQQCRRQFRGEIDVAHDLMLLDVAGGTVTVETLTPQVWPEGWPHGG